MKMDRELLLKHHFWILLGAFAFFALLLFIIIPIGVGGLISDKEKAIGEMLGKLKAKSPHTNGELTKLENQAQSLAGRRATVHNEMSTRQKDLFWWLTRGLGSGLAGPETAGAKKDLVSFP